MLSSPVELEQSVLCTKLIPSRATSWIHGCQDTTDASELAVTDCMYDHRVL